MKATLLTAVFLAHAGVFARLYVRHGRYLFQLLLVAGFVLLAAFYATSGWLTHTGVETKPSSLFLFRWAGLILCGLATPPFLINLYRSRREVPSQL